MSNDLRAQVVFAVMLAFAAPAPWPSIALPVRLQNSEAARKHLPATMPGGIAVFDFDGDGLPDIFVPNGGDLPSGLKTLAAHSDKLFRNRGNMRFEDVTAKSGLAGKHYAFGGSVADFDSDGRPDLLVSHLHGVTLYRNKGSGIFEDVTQQAGIDNHNRWSVGAAWFDYDIDGDPDLYITNYVRWDAKPSPNAAPPDASISATRATTSPSREPSFAMTAKAPSPTSATVRESRNMQAKVWARSLPISMATSGPTCL